MTVRRLTSWVVATAIVGTLATGCEDKPKAGLAPTASALASAKPPSRQAAKLAIETSSSKVEFVMDAPLEKIHGKAPASMTGSLFVDLSDITKSSGLLKVDLFKLELFQQKRTKEGAAYGEEKKSDMQNKHARTWLEISDDAPADKRNEYRYIEFKITNIKVKGNKNLAKRTGAERKVEMTVTGDFRLHGRVTRKTAEMGATFHYTGDKLVSVEFKTLKPFSVGLDEHDVRPREGFGKLAQKTLDVLSPKVAKQAPITLSFRATVSR